VTSAEYNLLKVFCGFISFIAVLLVPSKRYFLKM
jgi:hypothetical protein